VIQNKQTPALIKALFVILLYWVVESIFCSLVSNQFNLFEELLCPNKTELFRRTIVSCFFIIYFSQVQKITVRLENEISDWREFIQSSSNKGDPDSQSTDTFQSQA